MRKSEMVDCGVSATAITVSRLASLECNGCYGGSTLYGALNSVFTTNLDVTMSDGTHFSDVEDLVQDRDVDFALSELVSYTTAAGVTSVGITEVYKLQLLADDTEGALVTATTTTPDSQREPVTYVSFKSAKWISDQ